MDNRHGESVQPLRVRRCCVPERREGMNVSPPPKSNIGKRSKTWAADIIRKNTPTREEMAKNRFLAPVAHRVLSPELWRFTRRSVPRGVALGLFAAFIFPLGQILISTFLALPVRANVPLAALVTFVTNPFTLPFWLVIANRTGDFVLHFGASAPAVVSAKAGSGAWAYLSEAYEVAGATLVGYLVLSFVAPLIGYVISGWVWRAVVSRKRARRLKAMEARLDQRLGAL
jgi:uncharacterized protein (DUF2062 family)